MTFYANNRLLYNLTKPSVCTEEISSHSHTKDTHLCSSFDDRHWLLKRISLAIIEWWCVQDCHNVSLVYPAQIGDVGEGKGCVRVVLAAQERYLQFVFVNFRALPEVGFGAAPVCLEPNQYEVSNIDVCIVIMLLRWCLEWRWNSQISSHVLDWHQLVRCKPLITSEGGVECCRDTGIVMAFQVVCRMCSTYDCTVG